MPVILGKCGSNKGPQHAMESKCSKRMRTFSQSQTSGFSEEDDVVCEPVTFSFFLLRRLAILASCFDIRPHTQAAAWKLARQTLWRSSIVKILCFLMAIENRLNIWSTMLCVCPTGRKEILTFLNTPISTSRCAAAIMYLFLFSLQQLSMCR